MTTVTHGWPQCATDGCQQPAYTLTHLPDRITAHGAEHCPQHTKDTP